MSPVVFFDLLKSHQLSRDERCDICVVGAGAVGIYLTAALASKGFDVILVEAGGSTCSKASEVGFEAGFLGKSYPGATEGRAFGLGGTTSVWGGGAGTSFSSRPKRALRPALFFLVTRG